MEQVLWVLHVTGWIHQIHSNTVEKQLTHIWVRRGITTIHVESIYHSWIIEQLHIRVQ